LSKQKILWIYQESEHTVKKFQIVAQLQRRPW
jgi:hypothetical protein